MLGWFSRDRTQEILEHRKVLRLEVEVEARVLVPGKDPVDCRLTQVSPYGFRLASPTSLPRNVRLRLILFGGRHHRDLPVPITVLWCRRNTRRELPFECGGRFGEMEAEQWKTLVRRLFSGPGVDLGEVTERRRHVRVLQQSSIGDEPVVIRDVSGSGVGLLSRQPFPLGEVVDIVLNLGRRPIPCRGRVVRCQAVPEESCHHVGIAFCDMDSRTQRDLIKAVSEIMRARD